MGDRGGEPHDAGKKGGDDQGKEEFGSHRPSPTSPMIEPYRPQEYFPAGNAVA